MGKQVFRKKWGLIFRIACPMRNVKILTDKNHIR